MGRFVTTASVILTLGIGLWLYSAAQQPRNDRDWSPDQALLPEITLNDHFASIRHIRNISYHSANDYDVRYYDKSFDVRTLSRAWFMVELLSDTWGGVAHTLVSFEFNGPQYLAISVELRKEKGETFSPFQGMLRQYELMYVLGDERDLIQLRTNYRNHRVFLYPITAELGDVRQMFLRMLNRARKLQDEPEFYNTFLNSCTTNIVDHIRTIAPAGVPWSLKVLFPGYSDRLAYDLGLIEHHLSFEKTRARYYISDRARSTETNDDFSQRIRNFE